MRRAHYHRHLTRHTLQHLIEAFAGTFERHLQFVGNAQRYARQFREFIVDTDRGDPESLHLTFVVADAVQRQSDTLSLSEDFNTRAVEMLLDMFVVVLLSGACV